MRIFVAGATGVLGRPVVRALLDAGHDVTGMTRRAERATQLEAVGARAAVADAYDAAGLREAVLAARPEVVVHLLTDIPPALDPRKVAELMAGNDRLRIEGTRNLVAAAQAAGARRIVAESIAFAYRPEGGAVKDEDAPLHTEAPEPVGRMARALQSLEQQVGQSGLEAVILRFGWLYGPGTSYAAGDGGQAAEARRRRLPVVGKGDGVHSFLHVDDAPAAVLAALDGAPGTYNIVDDEPARQRDWLPAYAEALGARPPRRVPRWLAQLVAGRVLIDMATQLRGASNARAKAELGWRPRVATWREGFREALG
jgi:nucleoside-diphosphate-sugar epimerase